MKILVIGAGAIGGYVGGSLAKIGHELVFLCRPETAHKIEKGGLVIQNPEGKVRLQVRTALDPGEAMREGAYDYSLIAVKVYDTEAALAPMQSFEPKMGALVCLQNGVEAEGRLHELFPSAVVIPGTVTTAVARPEKNRVVVEKLRGLGLAGAEAGTLELIDALQQAGLNARHYPEALSMKWSKLLTNLTANPLSAILDMSPEEIFSNPRLFDLEMRQLREALAVMSKLGARLVNLPGTPVVPLALAAKYLPSGLARRILGRPLARGRGGKMPSFHVDLYGGQRKTEAPFLHGAVARFGKQLGIPTPVNSAFSKTVSALFDGRLPKETYAQNPVKFIHDQQL